MNCANHVDVPATAYCRTCGKPVCATCARDVRGVIYCEDCLASQVSGSMPPPPAPGVVLPGTPSGRGGSPGLAALLGLIPGVGAMYNGEFAKGFIHVLIFATLIWATDNISGIFGLFIAAFCVYMPIEAYQVAKAKLMGVPPPDPFGLNSLLGHRPAAAVVPPVGTVAGTATVDPGMQSGAGVQTGAVAAVPGQPAYVEETHAGSSIPLGAFILIGLGVLFLLNTFGWMHFDWVIARFWPIILILIGIRVLMKRQGY